MSILSELTRRNVIRVAIAYAVAAWVVLQFVDVVTPILGLPAWAPKLVFVLLAIGFVAALVAAWVYELTPEGLRRDADVHPDASIRRDTGRRLNYVIVAMLAAALALLLIDRNEVPDEAPPAAAAAVMDDATPSIAVLPFVNMSSDPEQEYFSDGITEEILNSLASVKELRVAGRTSSFAFKGQADDLRRIGSSLGVDHILEGSVRKSVIDSEGLEILLRASRRSATNGNRFKITSFTGHPAEILRLTGLDEILPIADTALLPAIRRTPVAP